MGAAEKFCLRWNDFESNISHAFKELREDKDFFDVTLACDDDQLQAHKVILSACSTFFRTILRRNHHAHPLLYLKGVKYADLQAVLNFMYHGEVNVAQEELNSFLAVAEDLKVKGLTQASSKGTDNHNVSSDPSKPRIVHHDVPSHNRARPPPAPAAQVPRVPPINSNTYSNSYRPQEDDEIQEVVPVKSEPVPVPTTNPYNTMVDQTYTGNSQQQHHEGVVADPNMEYGEEYADYSGYEEYNTSGMGEGQDANKELDDLMELHVNFDPSLDSGKPWQCTQCGKSFKKKCHVKDHIEGSHMVGLSFSCPYCVAEMGSRHRLRTHISNKHNSEHKEKQIKISQIPTNYQVIS